MTLSDINLLAEFEKWKLSKQPELEREDISTRALEKWRDELINKYRMLINDEKYRMTAKEQMDFFAQTGILVFDKRYTFGLLSNYPLSYLNGPALNV